MIQLRDTHLKPYGMFISLTRIAWECKALKEDLLTEKKEMYQVSALASRASRATFGPPKAFLEVKKPLKA